MARNETSRQRQYTTKALQDAYLELMKEVPADKISIVQLCERADVNRTTFYRHYLSIADLREKLIENFFQQIFEVLGDHPLSEALIENSGTPHIARRQCMRALNATIRNRNLCKQLLCEEHTDLAMKALEENLLIFQATIRSTGCTEAEGDLCYSYICGGLANLWTHWIASDFAAPKEKVAQIMETIITDYYGMLSNGFLLQAP